MYIEIHCVCVSRLHDALKPISAETHVTRHHHYFAAVLEQLGHILEALIKDTSFQQPVTPPAASQNLRSLRRFTDLGLLLLFITTICSCSLLKNLATCGLDGRPIIAPTPPKF